jgi:hypothetical protein
MVKPLPPGGRGHACPLAKPSTWRFVSRLELSARLYARGSDGQPLDCCRGSEQRLGLSLLDLDRISVLQRERLPQVLFGNDLQHVFIHGQFRENQVGRMADETVRPERDAA